MPDRFSSIMNDLGGWPLPGVGASTMSRATSLRYDQSIESCLIPAAGYGTTGIAPFAHSRRVKPCFRLGSVMSQDLSTWTRRTAVLMKFEAANTTSALPVRSSGTECGDL